MRGRAFLDAARLLSAGSSEPCWRVACVEAYYALMLECREMLFRWGFSLSSRDTVHSWVRFRFLYSTDAALRNLGITIENLAKLRNRAQYDLGAYPEFGSPARAGQAIQQVVNALAFLDAVEGDPVRQAAARAAIRP